MRKPKQSRQLKTHFEHFAHVPEDDGKPNKFVWNFPPGYLTPRMSGFELAMFILPHMLAILNGRYLWHASNKRVESDFAKLASMIAGVPIDQLMDLWHFKMWVREFIWLNLGISIDITQDMLRPISNLRILKLLNDSPVFMAMPKGMQDELTTQLLKPWISPEHQAKIDDLLPWIACRVCSEHRQNADVIIFGLHEHIEHDAAPIYSIPERN